jgi:hypothetical protein
MVAGPNRLVLKIFLNTGQIQNMFQIWAKNKKIILEADPASSVGCRPLAYGCLANLGLALVGGVVSLSTFGYCSLVLICLIVVRLLCFLLASYDCWHGAAATS